jgi:hypothetical protein
MRRADGEGPDERRDPSCTPAVRDTGLTGEVLVTRYIEAQLFGVTATDPLTFLGGCAALAAAGLAASVLPALRVMHVDPINALRRT